MLVRHLDQDLTAKEPTKSVLFTSKPLCAKLLILCLNGFVFCPLCVFFWTSAWDIVWNLDQTLLLGVPLTCLTCWAVSHGILLLFYLAQHPMQSWHNRRMAEGWKILTFMLRLVFASKLLLFFILSCSFVICFTLKICHIYIYSIHKRVCISYLNIRKILSVKHFDSVCIINIQNKKIWKWNFQNEIIWSKSILFAVDPDKYV